MKKPHGHLATLDGLRGLAAIAVLLFHLSYGWKQNLMPHAYLAVDFFFVLSGYVIAKSYESKLLGTLSFKEFLRLRLVRLYPLIFFGMLLGFADYALKYMKGGSLGVSGSTLFEELALGLLLIPMFSGTATQIFPFNSPAWSLFYEVVANIFYAALLKHLTDRRIYAVMFVSGLVLIYSGIATAQTGHGPTGADFAYGMARVGFSFFAGVMLYRLVQRGAGRSMPRVSGLWLGVALLLLLLVPAFWMDWVYNLVAIFFLFPLIVLLGVGENAFSARFVPPALWLGRISYPLYVLHYPFLIDNDYRLLHDRHGIVLAGVVAGATIGMVLVSWLVLVVYDEPLRRRLNQSRTQAAAKRAGERPYGDAAPDRLHKLAPQRLPK